MTRILIVSTVGLIVNGISGVITSYLEAMDMEGLEIHIASTMKYDDIVINKLKDINCKVYTFADRKQYTVKYIYELMRYIRRNKIDVIHIHGNSGTMAIELVAAWFGGCKNRIVHCHNTKCDYVKADKLMRPMFSILYTEALACGKEAGDWIYGRKKFEILPNGRNIDKYKYNEHIRKELRNKMDIKENQLVFGHVGGFLEQKNHIFLVDIYREIIKKNPNAICCFVGTGELQSIIKEKCKDIQNNVVFLGVIDNVNDYLNVFDLMFLPSLFEGLPLVALEWQINGLPSILSDRITRECMIGHGIEFLSLEEPVNKWVDLAMKMIQNINRKENSIINQELISDTRYNIKNTANELKLLYKRK